MKEEEGEDQVEGPKGRGGGGSGSGGDGDDDDDDGPVDNAHGHGELEEATVDARTGHVSKSGKPLITLEEMSEKLGFGCFHVQLLFVVSAIWMADAMEMMLISFIAPPLQCTFGLTDAEKALITSVVFFGMFLGASVWGWFQDHAGRKIG